jgi:outer membrane protein
MAAKKDSNPRQVSRYMLNRTFKQPIFLITCFAAIAPPCLYAQANPPSLNLADARAMAIKNHPRVLASQAAVNRAGQMVVQAKSAYYPTLNGDITSAGAVENARIGAGLINDPRLFNHFGTGVTLSQLITDSGRTPNLVATSKLQGQASEQDARATNYDIILGVDQAYYETLLSQQLVTVAQQAVATRQTVVDQVSELFRNKLRSEVDLSFAQVNLADAQLMLIRAQDRLNTAYARLGQALGTNQSIHYQLAEQPLPPVPPADEQALVAQAYQNRPELQSMRLQTDADRHFARAEADLKLPTVSFVGVAGAIPWIQPGNANPNIPDGYGAAAINISIPIFNGHLFSARRRAAEFQLVAANQQVRDWENRIAQDVRASSESARSAYQAIGTAQQLLRQANLAFDLAQQRYTMGLASIVELSQAQLGQTQAQVENVNAKYGYQEAYAALQYSLGLLH